MPCVEHPAWCFSAILSTAHLLQELAPHNIMVISTQTWQRSWSCSRDPAIKNIIVMCSRSPFCMNELHGCQIRSEATCSNVSFRSSAVGCMGSMHTWLQLCSALTMQLNKLNLYSPKLISTISCYNLCMCNNNTPTYSITIAIWHGPYHLRMIAP